jgi:hypothetical protein
MDVIKNMDVIKEELDHFKDKFVKIIQIFLSKRSDPDSTWPKKSRTTED